MTLNQWFDFWMDTYKKNKCRETTRRTYKACYNRIRKELGDCQLQSLNLNMMQRAFNNLQSDSAREHTKRVLVDMLERAVAADMINKNVAKYIEVRTSKRVTKERRIISEAEEAIFLGSLERNSLLYAVIVVALNTGMRIGEILGLSWDCVDFKNNMIHVKRSLANFSRKEGGFKLFPPKSEAGNRSIPLVKAVKEVLLEQRMRKSYISSVHDPDPGFENLVFVTDKNHPIAPSKIFRGIDACIDKINRENSKSYFEHFSMHCLRHTFATRCIARGMKPKVLQKILGHTTLQMTMDLYCHVEEVTIRNEMALYAELA